MQYKVHKNHPQHDLNNLMQCENCKHVQLNCIVNRERLFKNYCYVAGTSEQNRKHFSDYANDLINKFFLTSQDTVIDIASNDGCFLRNFQNKNIKVIGIDPAQNIAEQANQNGILTIPEFFGSSLATKIFNQYGKIKLITCNNMLAHNADITDIINGVKIILNDDGSFIFENSYLLDIVNQNTWDLIYHEHIHHFHITPLIPFFAKFGMDIYHVERVINHGGSIRVFTCLTGKRNIDSSIKELIELEKTILHKLSDLCDNIKKYSFELTKVLYDIKKQNKTIAIFGMPAKATTLLYALDIDPSMICFAVDDAPLKQNTFSPGKHIPVYSTDMMYYRRPDYMLVLAWNFAQNIMLKHKKYFDEGGGWIVPLPELKVIG